MFEVKQGISKKLNSSFLTADEVLNDQVRVCLLVIRILSLIMVVTALTIHVRSIKVFRWEQAVSAGILVTYSIVNTGLSVSSGVAIDAQTGKHKGMTSQVFLTGVGFLLFGINAGTLYRRWKHSHQITQAVAEMLVAIGMPIKRQIKTKVFLSAGISLCLLLDLLISPFLYRRVQPRQ